MLIYLLQNKVNGKAYVGQTLQSLERRLAGHRWESYKRKGCIISKAIAKHGWHSFTAKVLKNCASQQELDSEEIRLIFELGTQVPRGYNIANGGNGAGQHSESSKRKMSEQRKGRPAHPNLKRAVALANSARVISEETHKRLSESQKGNTKGLGHVKLEEVKQRIGNAQKADKNHAAKYTWEQIIALRKDYAEGFKVCELVKKYNMSHPNVSRIVHNKMWVV